MEASHMLHNDITSYDVALRKAMKAHVIHPFVKISEQVQYTKAKEVPGLPPLSDFVMNKEVPVNSVWKMLPWNGGRAPTCSVEVKYLDDEMRIVADKDGELFVYMRPVDPRGL